MDVSVAEEHERGYRLLNLRMRLNIRNLRWGSVKDGGSISIFRVL